MMHRCLDARCLGLFPVLNYPVDDCSCIHAAKTQLDCEVVPIFKRILKIIHRKHPTEGEVSLPEVHRSIHIPKTASFWKKMLAYAGPGFLIAVGYMDPGNWATDLQGGARFGFSLLSIILISSLIAMFLQYLCVKLGVATGRDLAQACRDHYPRSTVTILWLFAEIAM